MSSKSKLVLKSLSTLLSVVLLFEVIPMQAFAAFATPDTAITETQNSETVEEEPKTEEQVPYVLNEDISKREQNVKHFRMSDGTMQAVSYAVPVHFEQNGTWVDYDNSLIEIEDEEENSATPYALVKKKDLKNKFSNYSVRFSKESNRNKLVRLEKDGLKLSWQYADTKNASAQVQKVIADEDETTIENLTSTVKYKNIFKKTDLEYIVGPDGLKENLYLNSKKAPTEFVAEYKVVGLTPVQKDEKTIHLLDEQGNIIFVLEAPYMIDANGVSCDGIVLHLENVKKNTFTVRMQLDVSWTQDVERAYPILVDPCIQTEQYAKDMDSTFVSSKNPNKCYGNPKVTTNDRGSLYVGNINGFGQTKSYLKFTNLPDIGVASKIVDAKLCMGLRQCEVGFQMDLRRVTSTWDTTTLCWNQQPQSQNEILDYKMLTPETSIKTYLKFEVTDLVRGWYSGDIENNGIVFSTDKTSPAKAWFFSSNYTTYNVNRPLLLISYRNMTGYENYWSYTSLPAARYGTASVNNFNGNLIFSEKVSPDNGGNLMPVALQLTYNCNGERMSYSYLAKNMQTNYHMFLVAESGQLEKNGYRYYLNDSDGTRHWFYFEKDTNTGKDEDGLGLTLDIIGVGADSNCQNAKFKITDKDSVKMYFDADGHLLQITNTQGISSTVQYETVQGCFRIKSVTDGAGRVYSFKYESSSSANLLTGIIDPAGRKTSFEYGGGILTEITYPDGKRLYLHYTNYELTCIEGLNGVNTCITYDGSAQKRVKTIAYGTSTTNLEKYNFQYLQNETKLTDLQGRSYTYQFNDFGQTTGVVSDTDGSAQFFKMNPGNSTDRKANKLIQESRVIQSVTNYVVNPGFARNLESYRQYVEDTANQSITVDTATKHLTKSALKITKNGANKQRVDVLQSLNNLSAGTYTFSVYANTKGTKLNGSAHIIAEVWDSSGYWVSSNWAESVEQTNDWERRSVTFSVPENCEVRLLVGFPNEGNGTVWFDDIQLEKGENVSTFNLVENSGFTNGMAVWEWDKPTEQTHTWAGLNGFDYCGKLVGSGGNCRDFLQHIPVSGKEGDAFSFGMWVWAASAPTDNGTRSDAENKPSFKIGVHYYDLNGAWKGFREIPCNPDLKNAWQFVTGELILPQDCSSIAIAMYYDYNVNNAYITGAFCYKEQYGQTYTYDKNGNVVSSVDLAKSNSTFSYQGNQMSKMLNPSGSRFLYNYDKGSENLHYALTSDGREYSFAYDNKGNTTIADIQARQVSAAIENNQEYFLMNAYSGLAMDSYWKGNTGDLTTTYRYMPYNLNQHWKFEAVNGSSDVFYLKSVEFKDRYLNVCSGLGIDDVNLEIFPFDGKAKEQFKFVKQEDGSYGIFTGASGFERCIDGQKVAGKEVLQSTHIRQVDCDKNNLKEGQKWYLIPVVPTENQLIRTEASYTPSGNFVKTQSDQRGNVTSYAFDENKGTLTSTTDALGNQTAYTYDSKTDAMTSVTAGGMTNSYAYENDRLKNINVNGALQYQFEYDDFGRTSATKVGNGTNWRNLSSLSYNNNGLMTNQTYGNGDAIAFSYDNLDRMTEKKYNDDANQRITYSYGNDGNLAQTVDFTTGTRTKFTYDLVGRVAEQKEYASTGLNGGTLLNSTKFIYADKTNYLTGVEHKSPLGTQNIGYRYGNAMRAEMPDQIYDVTWNGAKKVSYSYDGFGRLTNKQIGGKLNNKLTYIDRNESFTTTLVKSVETAAGTFTYTYDSLGNIVSVSDGTYTTTYVYDNLNQLVRSNDEKAGKTFTYAYTNGNITEKKEYAYTTGDLGAVVDTTTWSYGDSTWSDLLTNFNGEAITYDTIGNPLTIGNKSLTWQGRQLQSITEGANTYSYKYNMDGQRRSKTVNGVTTEYFYSGNILAGQKTGDNTLVFMYDNNGDVFGFTYNGTEYFYVKNAQNDVVAITDANGTIIARYTYDDWGKVTSVTDANGVEITDTNHIANINPLRYRSYYFDTETDFYFLNTRYFNPQSSRFISADDSDIIDGGADHLVENNLFSYCLNNPIAYSDDEGNWVHLAIGAGIGAFMGVTTSLLSGERDMATLVVDGVFGAVSGALAASGVGLGGQILGGAFLGATQNLCKQNYIQKKKVKEIDKVSLIADTTMGAVSGLLGGKGANGKRLCGIYKTSKLKLKTAKSPSKIAAYQAKKIFVRKAAFKSTARYVAVSSFSAGLSYGFNKLRSFFKW